MQTGNHQVSENCEVLIIGSGLAGMVAAIELAKAGKNILVLDRDQPERLGGLARESFGGINIVNSRQQQRGGIQDDPELAFRDWCSMAHFGDVDRWPKAWVQRYVERSRVDVGDYLTEAGVKFFPVVHWVERGLFKPGNSVPRFHMVWGTGHGLITTLKRQWDQWVKEGRIKVLFHHKVEQLTMEAGRICGCYGKTETPEAREFSFRSQVVVVAAGGICGNLELVRKNWHRDFGSPPERLLNGAHRFGDGTLHRAISGVGGTVTYLDRQWNYAAGVRHPNPDRQDHGLSLVPPKSALWMNFKGQRIGPLPLMTGFDTRYLVEQICQQERKYSWQVLNWKIAVKELAVSGSQYNDAMRDKKFFKFIMNVVFGNKDLVRDLTTHCPDFVVANTIEELAAKMNALQGDHAVDPHLLASEIRAYDQMIDRGPAFFSDDQLRRIEQVRHYKGDRVRTCRFQKIDDPKAKPLIAIREFILTRKTLGGAQTNLQSQVLDKNGEVIPGLYAVGEVAGFGGGGIHGIGALEGTFLGGCIITAQAAAKSLNHLI